MMTPKELEDRIGVRAHEIWEREGRTYGNHEGHWHRATKEIEEEEDHRKARSRH
ncbi:DUF2934 domain-containing protein (plasmid) [Sinorhizobium meliloti]|uniref:DUF2934 domain-containing protein n=1 Tax=Rhizobium meliloti TaxID=382 RepID=UPI000B496E5F|nr:DUF2934 domain-containing protein [Sinorhizobium meliloti]ASP87716.1 DUF2934 domain-containing protein [Sinorhizobium meliloti]MQW26514.1 DUF2934 domain-containing protein [Sinorhizobium meliloti]